MLRKLIVPLAVLTCLAFVTSANAKLILSVRAISATGAAEVLSGTSVQVNYDTGQTNPTGSVLFGVYADPDEVDDAVTPDGLLHLAGSLVGYGTKVVGNISGLDVTLADYGTGNYDWNGAGYQIGLVQDIDGNGGDDVGFKTSGSTNDYVRFMSTYAPTGTIVTRNLSGSETEFLVGTFSFALESINTIGTDSKVQFDKRTAGLVGVQGQGIEDNVTSTGTGSVLAGTGYHVGFTLHENVDVPEPSTFVLLGMGCLALLAFRRRK